MNFYFTFGFLSPHSGKYVCINAPTWSCAHNKMAQRYDYYQYQYTESDFMEVIKKYPNLEMLEEL